MIRVLLGPVLVSLLLGIALYGAFCVNVAPTVQPVASPTLIVIQPTVYQFASPSPDIFTAPAVTPTLVPERLPVIPEPTATSTPTPLPPTHTPETTATPVVPMRQRG